MLGRDWVISAGGRHVIDTSWPLGQRGGRVASVPGRRCSSAAHPTRWNSTRYDSVPSAIGPAWAARCRRDSRSRSPDRRQSGAPPVPSPARLPRPRLRTRIRRVHHLAVQSHHHHRRAARHRRTPRPSPPGVRAATAPSPPPAPAPAGDPARAPQPPHGGTQRGETPRPPPRRPASPRCRGSPDLPAAPCPPRR